MQINKDRFKTLWKSKDQILKDNADNQIAKRFDWLNKKIDELLKVSVAIKTVTAVDIDGVSLTRNTESFGPIHDEHDTLSGGQRGSKECLKKMNNILKSQSFSTDHNTTVWKILTGEPENGGTRDSLFRIFSDGGDDSANKITSGINAPDYYFASNNYFFHIIRFLQKVKKDSDIKFDEAIGDGSDKIPLVLTYDGTMGNPRRPELSKRFVLKFLWMWANKDNIITLPSLQIMRNFCESELCKELIGNEYIITKDYNYFIEFWRIISDEILTALGISSPDDIQTASKLLSCLLYDYDTTNILDLILSGCKSVILYGAPGTGKTYEAKKVVVEMLELNNRINEIMDKDKTTTYDKAMKQALTDVQFIEGNDKGSWYLVQFHPSYSYEDFIGGIKPGFNDKMDLIYKLESGQFKKFCDVAAKNKNKKFIFIIDEINRSNLSAVFGELLYCLEYREEEISLPYFKEKFSIPENVYVIGTMNDVDKSLQVFDRALRRRFYFYHHKPNMNILRSVLSDDFDDDSLEKYIKKCKELNQSITEKLQLEAIYQIGHAYFLKIKDFFPDKLGKAEISKVELEKLWEFSLLPLLEEYLGNKLKASESKLIVMKENFCK